MTKTVAVRKRRPKPPWGIQVFLNEPHHEDKGWIKGTVVWPTWRQGRPDILLHIADCDRKITLDFDLKEDVTIEERIVKLERLRDTINTFAREAIKALRASQPKKTNEDNAKVG